MYPGSSKTNNGLSPATAAAPTSLTVPISSLKHVEVPADYRSEHVLESNFHRDGPEVLHDITNSVSVVVGKPVMSDELIGNVEDLFDNLPKQEIDEAKSTVNNKTSLKVSSFTKPLQNDNRSNDTSNTNHTAQCFSVLYTKRCNKKRKTYADGIVVIREGKLVLYDSEAKQVSQVRIKDNLLNVGLGSSLHVGSMEVDISSPIPYEQFLSGKAFMSSQPSNTASTDSRSLILPKYTKVSSSKDPYILQVKPSSAAMFDPNTEHSLILCRGDQCKGTVDIVVDPALSRLLRPHQRDGVKFLFECVTGMRSSDYSGRGCILADEMGLGKSLQAITLIWTMIKQSPVRGGRPFVKKCVVVCPASLVDNWCREVAKFLGPAKLRPISITENGTEAEAHIDEFVTSPIRPLLIISYETFRKHSKSINSCSGFELLVCDEGHRLKSSSGNKTIAALEGVPTLRRIILTGTPLQNQLDEFFAVISFVNPQALGRDAKHFKRVFQIPIERGRDKGALEEDIETANARSQELFKLTQPFVLRRTSEVNQALLPPKTETTIFVRLSQNQIALYQNFIESNQVRSLFCSAQASSSTSGGVDALRLILRLKQLCTHPLLVGDSSEPLKLTSLEELINASGKFRVLDEMLAETRSRNTSDRIVLVSSFTSTLDLVSRLCELRNYRFLRLDGSTKVKDRQHLVNRFNNTSDESLFVFLLSSKAGGCGLNLIGANRLVLIDPDWNPAVDMQAMARIWRDGQRKPVFIYRLLSTGTIEERVYQRQILKAETTKGVFGSAPATLPVQSDCQVSTSGFSKADLKRLFELQLDTPCDSFDLLQKEDGADGNVSTKWPRYSGPEDILGDEVLRALAMRAGEGIVSWVHSVQGEFDTKFDAQQTSDIVEPGSQQAKRQRVLIVSTGAIYGEQQILDASEKSEAEYNDEEEEL